MNDIFDLPEDAKNIDVGGNFAELGDDVNIIEKDPTLRKVLIGAGWDFNAFNADTLDMDMSVFLLDKEGKTRVDEDFVFYNQRETLEAAVKHNGDSRTGAGDGDDESISVDLHGIPFDVMHIHVVLSIYKGYEKEQNIAMVRNAYVRIVNQDTAQEIIRFKIDKHLKDREETGVLIASLNREGPKWHFKPSEDFVPGGLSELATRYGIIINQE